VTKKPPTLTVIDPASKPNPLAPPATLGKAGRELWNSLHADYIVEDASGLAMLSQICRAADRVAEYGAAIECSDDMIPTARDIWMRSSSGLRINKS
jgi:hypothetical protein